MRHQWSGRKLGRSSPHRVAMLRNMVTEFLDKERIVTTVSKAKELRPFAEKVITLGKRETLHARRRALRLIRKKSVVHKLFDTLAPRYADREGGYTRVIRLGFRRGDNAELALIELVESEPVEKQEAKGKKSSKKKSAKKKTTKKKTSRKKKSSAKKSKEE